MGLYILAKRGPLQKLMLIVLVVMVTVYLTSSSVGTKLQAFHKVVRFLSF